MRTSSIAGEAHQIFDCSERVAVVTGGAGNLGPVWADTLVHAGAHVVLLVQEGTADRPELADLQKHASVDLIKADVTSQSSLAHARDVVLSQHGRVDILVANAGVDHRPVPGTPLKLDDMSERDVDAILYTNILGTLLTVSTFGAPMVAAGGGSIIVIGSQYAVLAPRPELYSHIDPVGEFVKNPAYGASKAAVIQLVRSFAANWGRHGVRVNALSPGGVRNGQEVRFQEKFAAEVPLGRMMEADELAGPLLLLASDAGSYITGMNLLIDGGYSAW